LLLNIKNTLAELAFGSKEKIKGPGNNSIKEK